MPKPPVAQGERRRLVYEAYAYLNSERYSEDDAIPLDEDVVSYIKSFVYDKVRVSVTEDEVLRWLRKPEKFSPFIDEIAMERAMEWEWRVYDNLSADEKIELYKRLANHPDPFGAGRDTELDRAIRKHTGKQATSTAGAGTPKFKRFLDGGDARTEAARSGIQRARQRS